MTTKRSLETELADVSDTILNDLNANERIRLLIKAKANGDETQRDRLVESCPTAEYERPDHQYTNRALFAHTEAQTAVYSLWTTWLELQWVQTQLTHVEMMDLFDLYPTDVVEDPLEGIDFPDAAERITRLEGRQTDLLATLHTRYHVYRRFAEETIGVDLTEFLAFVSCDWPLEVIEETVSLYQPLIETINEAMIDEVGENVTLEDVITEEYTALAEDWDNADTPWK
jgi:hypothetical protein